MKAGRTVVVVEDDEAIGRLLDRALTSNGYQTFWSRTGRAGLALARREQAEVVLLDLGLPDADGVDLARRLRSDLPSLLLVMLTARGEEIDIVSGLDAGADDYLVKPFSLTVLLARLRAHLRSRPTPQHDGPVVIADLTVDTAARRCRLGTNELVLRPKEYELLETLALNAGTAVSREDLMATVWDENWFGSTKTLDVTIASLRRQLEAAATRTGTPPERVPSVVTLRGHGYRLDPPAVD
ncbi:response regulator transcription factor [Kribbella jiaozuonensis]|uniref:Response regulator transcription factor n=1 Tax=Kribbella jiaozuonensis TaxID=2575441 RepID=A0A4U3LP08_9ACTN|nr:response regulator transcription factor [Kribbella jiaozuonensis]TKK76246.1 response regulator transcription factor [Kribbella jiaozuonensis]